MIRLRGAIDRALGHRWLGPLIILLLAVVLVFVVLHTAVDAAHDEVGLACLAVAAVIFRLLVRPTRQNDTLRPPAPLRRRGPPARLAQAPTALIPRALPLPLRL